MSWWRRREPRDEVAPAWARSLARQLDLIIRRQEKIMASLDEVLDKVSANDDRLDSIVTLIDGLKRQLEDALSGVTLPPAVQAKVDAIFTQAEESSAKIDAALNANTPPPPDEG